jgi:hypothetical protein
MNIDVRQNVCAMASDWIEIDEGNVPRMGDELLGIDRDTGEPFELIIVTKKMVEEWTAANYIADWFTYFRALNPPVKRRLRADNGDPDTIVPAPAPHKKRPEAPHGE